jgi:hypothetical protein
MAQKYWENLPIKEQNGKINWADSKKIGQSGEKLWELTIFLC